FLGEKKGNRLQLRTVAVAVLRAVKYGRNHHSLRFTIDLINDDIGQPGHNPFERVGISARVPHQWERNQQFGAPEQPINHVLRGCRTILRDPTIDAFKIGDGLIVEDKLHLNARSPIFRYAPWLPRETTACDWGWQYVDALLRPERRSDAGRACV